MFSPETNSANIYAMIIPSKIAIPIILTFLLATMNSTSFMIDEPCPLSDCISHYTDDLSLKSVKKLLLQN